MDEAKRINIQIVETNTEIRVCTRLKAKGVPMRLGKPVAELLVSHEIRLLDLAKQLEVLKEPIKPFARPAAKPGTTAAKPAVATAKPAIAAPAAKPAASATAKPVAKAGAKSAPIAAVTPMTPAEAIAAAKARRAEAARSAK